MDVTIRAASVQCPMENIDVCNIIKTLMGIIISFI